MRRRVLRILKRLVEVAFVLLLLAFGALALLNYTDWGHERLRKIAEGQLQNQFPGSTIGKWDGDLRGEITLSNVVIAARDGKPMVTIDTLKVTPDLLPLLGKTVRLERVELDGVKVSIRPQPKKPAEPASTSSGGGGSAWAIELQRLEVTNASVEVTAADRTVAIDTIDVGGSLTFRDGALVSRLAARGQWEGKPAIATVIASYADGKLSVPWASLGGERSFACVLDGHFDTASDLVAGVVTVDTPARTVEKWSKVKLPGDVLAVASASGSTDHNYLTVDGMLGNARVRALAEVDAPKQTAVGFASVASTDLAAVSFGKVVGYGRADVAFGASKAKATAFVRLTGAVDDKEASSVVALAESDYTTTNLVALASRLTAKAAVVATVTRKGSDVHLDSGKLFARGTDSHVRGVATVALGGSGPITPTPRIVVNGTIHGDAIGYQDKVDVNTAELALHDFVASASPSGAVTLTANVVRSGKTIVVPSARIDAGVTYSDKLHIKITSHTIDSLRGTWTGNGGTIDVGPSIVVDNFHTGIGGSAITVAHASYTTATGDLAAKVDAQNVAVAAAVPEGKGTLEGGIDVKRVRDAWSGSGHVTAKSVWVGEETMGAIDGEANVTLSGHRVELDAKATDAQLGDVAFAAVVDGPRDLLDATAWKKLPRTSVHSAAIEVARFDASAVGASGTGQGHITIDAGQIHGELHVDDVHLGTRTLKVDAGIGPGDGNEIAFDTTGTLSNVLTGKALARVEVPEHLFDPDAWKVLDRTAMRGAVITIDDDVDATVWAALGLDQPYRGHVAATVLVAAGGHGAAVNADISKVTGGLILKPLEAKIVGGIDHNGSHAQVDVLDGAATVVSAQADSRLTLDHLSAGQLAQVVHLAVEGKVTIPERGASDVTAIIGRHDIREGTMSGEFDVAGTLGEPTGKGRLDLSNIVLAPMVSGRDAPRMDALRLTAEWGGESGHAELTASERAGGTLHVEVDGRPDHTLAELAIEIDAKSFDIAPLVAFAPGSMSAAAGIIDDAHVAYTPLSKKLTGHLNLVKASIPLTKTIGTLRDTTGTFTIDDDKVHVTIDGKLGGGTANLEGDVTLVGALPKTIDVKGKVRKISPLGKYQPAVDADLTEVKLARDPATGNWSGNIRVENGSANMSLAKADELLAVGQPDDLRFVDGEQKNDKTAQHIPPPTKAWLEVDIRVEPATLHAYDPRAKGIVANIEVVVEGNLRLTLGDGIALGGSLTTDRGNLDIVGRRYDIDHADVSFADSIYPLVDVRIVHAFPEMSLVVSVVGDMNEALPTPVLTAENADQAYSPDQLYGFLLGGEPGGDPANAAHDAALVGGSTVASSTFLNATGIGRKLKKIYIDSAKYTPQTATSSASYELGHFFESLWWFPGTAYVAFRGRQNALPTENPQEISGEYYPYRRILVDATFGTVQSGGDVLYRLRW